MFLAQRKNHAQPHPERTRELAQGVDVSRVLTELELTDHVGAQPTPLGELLLVEPQRESQVAEVMA
jgi:hypothetical protein